MGNAPSTPPQSDSDTTSLRDEYKGKRFEPPQHLVDSVYKEIMESYEQITKRCRSQWYGMDEELFMQKLRDKIRENHPGFFTLPVTTTDTDVDQGGAAIITPPINRKKKKRKVDCGPIIMHGLRIPKEIVAHSLRYCDRSSINSSSLSCRGIHQAIQERGVAKSIPWPNHCPWPKNSSSKTWDSRDMMYFVASKGGSRFAVVRAIDSCEYFNLHNDGLPVDIWDRCHGLIGGLESGTTPIFSPDGNTLLAPLVREDYEGEGYALKGFRAVQLPPIGAAEMGPFSASECLFRGENDDILSIAFVNNDTIAAIVDCDHDEHYTIDLWKINQVDGRMYLFYSRTIVEDRVSWSTPVKVVSYVAEKRTILAVKIDLMRIVIRDLSNNESLLKTVQNGIQELRDLAFSPKGKLVVSTIDDGVGLRGQLYIYDCNVNKIGEIGEPRVFCRSCRGIYTEITSFSADGTKVSVWYEQDFKATETHIIDINTGSILSEKWDHSIWNTFAG